MCCARLTARAAPNIACAIRFVAKVIIPPHSSARLQSRRCDCRRGNRGFAQSNRPTANGRLTIPVVDECIFCGQSFGPDRIRSREHAAPNWCRKLLPDRGRAEHLFVVETAEGVCVENRGLKNPFTTVAADVCEPCNNGWMQELEASSETLLGHFIQGHERRIRFWRQVMTATWALKTALVWDAVSPEDRTVALRDFRILRGAQRPTAQQQVWLGRYAGDDPHSFRRTAAHVIGAENPDPRQAHAYLIAITLGQLALVVFGQHVVMPPYRHRLPAQFANSMIEISPPAHEIVAWPPVEALGDEALETCVRSLGGAISPSQPSA